MKNLGTVILETKRLILRRAAIEDAENMYKNWASDEKVTKYMTWSPYQDIDSARGYISFLNENHQKDNFYDWVIELKEIHEPIGSISVVQLREDIESAEVGYCIGSPWWHKGTMGPRKGYLRQSFGISFHSVGIKGKCSQILCQ